MPDDTRNGSLVLLPFQRRGRDGRLHTVQPRANPLVCVCPDPVTNRMGECQSCRRKPLALFRILAR